MKVIIEFSVENAAFAEPGEIDRVLARAIDKVKYLLGSDVPVRQRRTTLLDCNGNTVGSVRLEEE